MRTYRAAGVNWLSATRLFLMHVAGPRDAFLGKMARAMQSVNGEDFYRRVLEVLKASSVDFLIGGAFAMRVLADIERDTKDFDLMLRPRDLERALVACRQAGFCADHAFSHWIAKVHFGEHFVDLIYRAGNGLCEVDDEWFVHAGEAEYFSDRHRICPPEEMIWQKAYIMERERFDGADVLHLIRSNAERIDWQRLLSRFGHDWPVLLSHLILFGFVYPQERGKVPAQVLSELQERLRDQGAAGGVTEPVCRGTLLSRAQYLPDVERWGYVDARNDARAKITPREIAAWTNAIDRFNRSR